jgi:hypothetical protein
MLVDISKYPNLSKDAKDILYRPPKVKHLYEKFWALVKQVHGREKKENDEEIVNGHRPRYPPKPAEERELFEQVLNRLEQLCDEDFRLTTYKIQ